jgi:hypothetical protein
VKLARPSKREQDERLLAAAVADHVERCEKWGAERGMLMADYEACPQRVQHQDRA